MNASDYTALGRLRATMSPNPATSRLAPPTSAPSTSGSSDQLVDVVRLHAAAVDDVALVGGRRRRTTGAAASGCARGLRRACCGVALRPVPIAHTGS